MCGGLFKWSHDECDASKDDFLNLTTENETEDSETKLDDGYMYTLGTE